MKIGGNSIRPGMIIEHQGRLWVAVKTQHTQPGKGGAYLQVELKDIQGGTKLNERFRSSESVERVRLDQANYQYLYDEGEMITLMHSENFEQLSVLRELVGEPALYLQEGMILTVESHEGKPLAVTLPEHATVAIAETEPTVKGQTAAASYKPALLENGVRTLVPPHIEVGTRIVVNTADSSYVERARD